MSPALLMSLSYALLAVFVVAFVTRSVKLARLPIHLRWELAPIPHEKGKGSYGGSYLEESEWWTKKREKDLFAELSYMGQEILFLKALFEHKRRLWWFSFPFHVGLYFLTGAAVLLVLGGIGQALGIPGPGLGILSQGLPLLAGVGYGLGLLGAVGLFITRLTDQGMRNSTSFLTYFNVILLGGMFGTGLASVLTVPNFVGQVVYFGEGLLTADVAAPISGVLAAHVVLALVFLAYLPFTQMMHFVAKYFTYHDVRWEDTPLERGSKMEKELVELLGQSPTWAGPHVRADGKKTWVDIATDSGAREEEEK